MTLLSKNVELTGNTPLKEGMLLCGIILLVMAARALKWSVFLLLEDTPVKLG
jgi:hypothetical protein